MNKIIYNKLYKQENKEKIRQYALLNKEHISNYQKNYRKLNLKKYNEKVNFRKKTDAVFKLKHTLRNRILMYLKINNLDKKYKFNDYIGCNPMELKTYLESKFTDDMNWSNHGRSGWHIDHIIPLSSAKTEDEMYKLCHYTNLQPLWAKDNLKKGSKIC